MRHKRMWSIPNVISLTRLVVILPLAWVMAVHGHSEWVGIHQYSGKSVGMFGSLFLLDAFFFGFHVLPFYVALTAFSLANLEGLLIFSTFAEVDEPIGSFFRRRSWRAERTRTLPDRAGAS